MVRIIVDQERHVGVLMLIRAAISRVERFYRSPLQNTLLEAQRRERTQKVVHRME